MNDIKNEVPADGPELAGVPFGDDQYDSEMQSTAIDLKQLSRAEGNPEDWDVWHEQLTIARDYYRWRGETEMADDVEDFMKESVVRHKTAMDYKAKIAKR